ncbi:unnamed protein product [Auanema sp. JU1783]|nr:unnamed protein product [Auanema sp. JU1783]
MLKFYFHYLIGLSFISLIDAQGFLSFSKEELCKAEPHLSTCQSLRKSSGSRSLGSVGLTHERLKELAEKEEREEISSAKKSEDDLNPFDDITTRSPYEPEVKRKKHFRNLNEYYMYKQRQYYAEQSSRQHSSLYTIYPGLHPKDKHFCSDLQGNFAFTCQPSKPLRIDLVEFCKDYSAFCQVPNVHQLPGPRLGAPPDAKGIGHVGVSGKFGLGVGAVPGMEVGVGWGVDVGPIPGMGESVGVDLGFDLGLLGASQPEQYRRGMGTGKNGNGIVGINGGVGVKAPGTGPIGVGTGLGVG